MIGSDGVADLKEILSTEEITELARLQRDPAVVGYAIVSEIGEEIDVGGEWSDELAPIFSNVFDFADKIGTEFGETPPCAIMVMEGTDFEIAGFALMNCRAVIIRRRDRGAGKGGGLRSVS